MTPQLRPLLAVGVLPLLLVSVAPTTDGPGPAHRPDTDPPGAGRGRPGAVHACGSDHTPAWAIQGSGARTPLEGRTVVTEGVVVGDFEGPSPALRGFYLQDPRGDDDPSTSDAVFVFNGDADRVAPGDRVRVEGTVREFQGQTQLGDVTGLDVCGSGEAVVPTEVRLPVPHPGWLERYEGMLVRFPQPLYVTGSHGLGRFGEVVLSAGGRLPHPTSVAPPGALALMVRAANERNRVVLDDADNAQNPDPVPFGRGGRPLSAANTLRAGDRVTGLTGVLTWGWGGNRASGNAWRVRPLGSLGGGRPDFEDANPRLEAPDVGGSLRVGSINLLNYFDTFTGCRAGVTGGPTDCRGADDAEEFTRQWQKTAVAITAMDVDVLGVVEIENDGYGPASAIGHLTARLNELAGAGRRWAFVDVDARSGTVDALGDDAIKVGFLYRPSAVEPVGRTAVLATPSFVTGGDPEPLNRPSLAQAFEAPGGERFVAVINHWKSKGSPCRTPDAGDGQGNCNEVRVAAARELAAWLADDPTETADPDVLILGDLNAHAMEDPVRTLRRAGFVDLVPSAGGGDAYSFVFDGEWGSLDHALASPTLAARVTGAAVWHVNADEPSVLDYDADFKSPAQQEALYAPDPFRSSDHDPVLVGLELGG